MILNGLAKKPNLFIAKALRYGENTRQWRLPAGASTCGGSAGGWACGKNFRLSQKKVDSIDKHFKYNIKKESVFLS